MRITQITVNFAETCNLGDYSSTKPSIELTALLDVSDDVHAVIDELINTAKTVLHAKIDEELELVGKSPKYWAGDRYDVIYGRTIRFAAIVPAASVTQLDGGFYSAIENVRYPAAREAARRQLSRGGDADVAFFDCAVTTSVDELRAYVTEQNAIHEQRQAERRRREEEERQRQAEWGGVTPGSERR